jgi:glycosyltransferase involved in cell wall biosynthesis
MKTLILAAGRFGDAARQAIAAGREPRLDVFELAERLGADVIDYLDVDRSTRPLVKLTARALGASAAVAELGFAERRRYDAFLTTGEDIGLPLALLLKLAGSESSHTMIAHTLFPKKKRVFFQPLGVASHLDRVLVYSTSEERLTIDELGVPAAKVLRIHYHADEKFFHPTGAPLQPNLVCAAGQLLRDYDCLNEAVRDEPIEVQIAAGSPWIDHRLTPRQPLPPNEKWGKLSRAELRELYARAAVAVVPIVQNHYQTGIATILEMMAMGKCVIATRTFGQTDTIVDGVTGIYVPPGDPRALRDVISKMLAHPEDAARIGEAARRFVDERAGLDLFVERLVQAVEAARATRGGRQVTGVDSVST